MHHITINIKDDRLAKQVVRWLEHFKDDGLEIVSVEDFEDLKALQATRQEDSTPIRVVTNEAASFPKPRKSQCGNLKDHAHPERMAREQTAWSDAVSDAP